MFSSLRDKLNNYFLSGAKPTQDQFSELIDSVFIKDEDGITTQMSNVGQVLCFSMTENHQGDSVFQQDVKIKGDLTVEGNLLIAPLSETTDAQLANVQLSSAQTSGLVDSSATVLPTGTVLPYCGETIPDGFLLCDGSDGTPAIAPLVDTGTQTVRYIIKVN